MKVIKNLPIKEKWYLAADKSINSQIIDNLDPDVKSSIERNIPSDLTKTANHKILSHFADLITGVP